MKDIGVAEQQRDSAALRVYIVYSRLIDCKHVPAVWCVAQTVKDVQGHYGQLLP